MSPPCDLIAFTSDWLFPTAESRAIVHALNAVAANVSFVEVEYFANTAEYDSYIANMTDAKVIELGYEDRDNGTIDVPAGSIFSVCLDGFQYEE